MRRAPRSRRRDAVSGFREKYGAPRDHAAEARGFASGKREINRLKRQGK